MRLVSLYTYEVKGILDSFIIIIIIIIIIIFVLKPGNFLKTKLADHKLKIQLQLKPLRHDDVSVLPSSR